MAEIIEADPDCSEVAHLLLAEFGSLGSVLSASRRQISLAIPRNPVAIDRIQWFGCTMRHVLSSKLKAGPLIENWNSLLSYLRFEMAFEKVEEVRVLYLDSRLRLIKEEVVARGTVDACAFYPREIIGRALNLGATTLVLVHNHPSGDPTPSVSDIAQTTHLSDICQRLDLRLLDHLVIGRDGVLSMREAGVLK